MAGSSSCSALPRAISQQQPALCQTVLDLDRPQILFLFLQETIRFPALVTNLSQEMEAAENSTHRDTRAEGGFTNDIVRAES
jgi:hypothetical protein